MVLRKRANKKMIILISNQNLKVLQLEYLGNFTTSDKFTMEIWREIVMRRKACRENTDN